MTVVGRIMAPKDIRSPLPGTFEWVTLHSKRDSAAGIEGMGLEMGRIA